MIELKKSKSFAGPEGPVVLVIMDGVGIGKNPESDFVKQAKTPKYGVAGAWRCRGTAGRRGYGQLGSGP